MKRILYLSLVLTLILATTALAELPQAMPRMDLSAFEGVPGFHLDPVSGDFSLTNLAAEALKGSIARGELRAASSGGIVVMYLEIQGNEKTGMYAPMLKIAYRGGKTLNASSISLRVKDVRYDFSIAPETDDSGLERYAAQLNQAGVNALLTAKEGATVRLYGENSYTTKIDGGKSSSTKARLENHSIPCLDLTEELSELNFSGYRMLLENSEDWYNKTGVRPMFQETALGSETYPEGKDVPTLDTTMQTLSPDGTAASVKLLREKLYEMNLLTDTAVNKAALRQTIMDLQAKYGLIQSGSLDGMLLKILYGEGGMLGDQPEAAAQATLVLAGAEISGQAGAVYAIDDVAEIGINRYWSAGRAMTTKPMSALSYQDVLNTDHLLMIADGAILNLLPGEMNLNRTISAVYTLDGKYTYPATIKCESDGGERMDTSLLPLGRSRIFIIAEAPQSALSMGGAWTLTVELEGRKLVYDLK